jgi:uncharacterized protein involved in exopolysaccharide biosynthesis
MEFDRAETSVFELVTPFIQHWKSLLAGVIIAIVIAVIVSAVAPKRYDTSMLLQVGSVLDNVLENPNTVTYIINSEAFQEQTISRIGLQGSRKKPEITAEIDTLRPSTLVSVHVVADQPENAVRFAQAVADGILERHTSFFKEKVQLQQRYRKDLETSIQESENRISGIRAELDSMKSGHDAATELLAQTKLGDEEKQLMLWKRELLDLQGLLSAPQTRETSIAAAPVSPNRPLGRNLFLNIAIAIVLSLFFIASWVLISDQYRKYRRPYLEN